MSNINVFIKRWKSSLQNGVVFAAIAAIALWFGLAVASPPAAAASPQEGEAICAQSRISCHTADGSSAAFGPDLKAIANRRDSLPFGWKALRLRAERALREWLVQCISAPEQVLAKGEAIASELVRSEILP